MKLVNEFYVAVELGPGNQTTGVAVIEKVFPTELKQVSFSGGMDWVETEDPPQYKCAWLTRLPAATRFPTVIQYTKKIIDGLPAKTPVTLIVDVTGSGRPIMGMMMRQDIHLTPATITAGDDYNLVDGMWRIPKKVLASTLQVLLQESRLEFAAAMPAIPSLMADMLNFQVKVTTTANDAIELWREGKNDDLVLAVALAAWLAEQGRPVLKWKTDALEMLAAL
jgi:hypothetical protein